jgi:serine/threonine protein kinase
MTGTMHTIRGYEIIRQIGRGGMGVVYLARQPGLQRLVALKELVQVASSDPSVAARFFREAQVASSLSSPSIVSVYEFFEHTGVPYIVMEYVVGGSLRPHIRQLTTVQAIGVLKGVLSALSHAESHGVVHRDIKPENVLVTGSGAVKLADFGIAKGIRAVATGQFSTATGNVSGTPAYMSPEQAMGEELGPCSDLYSVGVLAYEMLAGPLPFGPRDTPMAIMMRQVRDAFPPPQTANPELPAELAGLIEAMTAKAVRDRPQSAADASAVLEQFAVREYGALWERDAALPVPQHVAESSDYDAPIAGGEFNTYRPVSGHSMQPVSHWSLPAPEIHSWPSYSGMVTPESAPPVTPEGLQRISPASLPSIPAVDRVPTPSEPMAPAQPVPSPEAADPPRRPTRRRRLIIGALVATIAIVVAVVAVMVLATPTPPPTADRAQMIAGVRAGLAHQQQVSSVTCPPRIPKRVGFVVRCEAHLAPDGQQVDAYVTQRDAAGHFTTQYVLH